MRRKSRKSSRRRKTRTSFSFSSIPLPIMLAIIVVIILLVKMLASSNNTLGTTTYLAKGDDNDSSGSSDSGSGSSGSGSSGSGSSGSSDSGSSGSGSSGSGSSGSSSDSIRSETRTPNDVRTQTETKQNETRTEVRLSEEERIRTRTKDGQTRIDITSGGIKTRIETRDDRTIIKAEQEDGTEVELEDDAILKIEERLGASGIKIGTSGEKSFIVERNATGAVADFPISIDLATNTLTINTPSGEKTVAVLPDQAVKNIIAANVVSRIGEQAVVDATINSDLSSVSQLITLGEKNDFLVYEINGISDQKLLGFIPVSIEKTIEVSADTGEIVNTDVSFGNRIIDLLSF